VADDLQPGRDLFQHLGRRFADFSQAAWVTAAALADDLRLMHHHLPRQVWWQGLAPGGFPLLAEILILCLPRSRPGSDLLTNRFLEILQAQLQLHDLAVEPFGGLAVALPPQNCQLHLDLLDFEQRHL
jgi:hypothetical protein